MSKLCNQEKKKPNTICNPKSGLWININGPTHKKLMADNVLDENGNSLLESKLESKSNDSKPNTAKDAKKVKVSRPGPAKHASDDDVHVGDEDIGSDGLRYIVRQRTHKNGKVSKYWAKCINKGSNCKNQQGGNPILATLPTLSELAIPVGLTIASHVANDYYSENSKKQVGGGKSWCTYCGNNKNCSKKCECDCHNNQTGGNGNDNGDEDKDYNSDNSDIETDDENEFTDIITGEKIGNNNSSYLYEKDKKLAYQFGGGDNKDDASIEFGHILHDHDLYNNTIIDHNGNKTLYSGRSSKSSTEQTGGNPLLMAASDLIVPLGLTAGAHWLASFRETDTSNQTGGGYDYDALNYYEALAVPVAVVDYDSVDSEPQTGGGNDSLPVIKDPVMNTYLRSQNMTEMKPNTLIPLGTLIATYSSYITPTATETADQYVGSVQNEVFKMADPVDIEKYIKLKGIDHITPQTKFPFALVMGKDIFKRYIDNLQSSENKK